MIDSRSEEVVVRRQFDTKVGIYYSGKRSDGTVFDERLDGKPLEVLLGSKQIPKGIEDAIMEMEKGEERIIVLPPEKAYGFRAEEAVIRVPLIYVPHASDIVVGETIRWFSNKACNEPVYAKVIDKNAYDLTLDLNHPLAGERLTYYVKVIDG